MMITHAQIHYCNSESSSTAKQYRASAMDLLALVAAAAAAALLPLDAAEAAAAACLPHRCLFSAAWDLAEPI